MTYDFDAVASCLTSYFGFFQAGLRIFTIRTKVARSCMRIRLIITRNIISFLKSLRHRLLRNTDLAVLERRGTCIHHLAYNSVDVVHDHSNIVKNRCDLEAKRQFTMMR